MDLAARVRELCGAVAVRELTSGHQSRVFAVDAPDGIRLAVKVLDPSADREIVAARVDAVGALAAIDPRVCRPVALAGRLVNEINDTGHPRLVLSSEYADGVPMTATNPADAELMGVTLAGLHRSLAQVGTHGIPEVAALRAVPPTTAETRQLLHGDFNAANLCREGRSVRVFDFEDCGLGPRSFEIADALFMVRFDAVVANEFTRYLAFATAFVHGYELESGDAVDRDAVDAFVDLRVRALQHWLDDPRTAPVGIRNASSEWHATLRAFVRDHDERRG